MLKYTTINAEHAELAEFKAAIRRRREATRLVELESRPRTDRSSARSCLGSSSATRTGLFHRPAVEFVTRLLTDISAVIRLCDLCDLCVGRRLRFSVCIVANLTRCGGRRDGERAP